MQAQAVFDAVPEGRYVIVKGNSADANADFLRAGMETVIGEAVAAGDIEIVSETYTDNWDPAIAQSTMEQVLTAENNEVDAVLAENDGMAGGVDRRARGPGPGRPDPGVRSGRRPPALNRVALGTQTVDVWKDARELGKTAGEAAVALCADPDVTAVAGHGAVHDAGRDRRHVDPPGADPDHAGQPERGPRRRLDHRGGPLRTAWKPARSRPAPDRPSA